jgi:hypothetical protein
MLHREIHKTHTNVKRLQQSLEKSESLLKIERVATSARSAKIKDLEAKIMRLGVHPREAAATKDLIDQKDKEIAYLRGKLKITPGHPVQTLELMTATAEKEAAQTNWKAAQYQIKSQQDHIAKLEAELKEQQDAKESEISKDAADLSGKIGSLSFNQEENQRLRALLAQKDNEITALKENAAVQEQMLNDTNSEVNKLSQTAQELQIRVTGKPLIREIKERVWDGIASIIEPRWDYFKLMQEQIDMTKVVTREIRELQSILHNNPSKAQALIEYVNTLSKEALLEKRIMSRTETVMLAQKWVTKHQLTMVAQAKNVQMQRKIRNDQEAFERLQRYGFPFLFDEDGKLYTWEEFAHYLKIVGTRGNEIDAAPTPITAFEANKILRNDYTAHQKLREVCRELGNPNYTELTELDISIRAAKECHTPNMRDWANLAPVILDAISFQLASQPLRPPPAQKQQPGSSTTTPTSEAQPEKQKKKQASEPEEEAQDKQKKKKKKQPKQPQTEQQQPEQ